MVVGTDRDEIDFQDENNETQTTAYDGADGVPANSLVRRAAFALRFGDLNPLISDFMTDDSKVIYKRDVVDRVPVAGAVPRRRRRPVPGGRRRAGHLGGRPVHHAPSRYPYAQQADTDQLTERAAGSTTTSTTCATR